jgi:hypothetical protein
VVPVAEPSVVRADQSLEECPCSGQEAGQVRQGVGRASGQDGPRLQGLDVWPDGGGAPRGGRGAEQVAREGKQGPRPHSLPGCGRGASGPAPPDARWLRLLNAAVTASLRPIREGHYRGGGKGSNP